MSSNPGEQPRTNPDETPQLRLLQPHSNTDHQLTRNIDWNRDLVEHSRDLLCVHDLEGRLLSVNPVPARLLGYTVEEILKLSMQELLDPKFRDQFDGYLRQIVSAGEATGILAVRTRTGQRRYWEYHCSLRTEGVEKPMIRGIAHDITDRIAAEKALRQSNKKLAETAANQEDLLRGLQLFRTLLDHSNDAIEVVEPVTMRLLDVNEKSCSELGYTREELLSMTIFDIDPQLTPDTVIQVQEDLLKAGFVIKESVHRRKNGTTFPIEVNLKRVQLDKEYVVAISRDITERKLRDGRLQEYERVLETLDEMIVVVNRDHRYVLANRAFLRYRGMTKDQVAGRHVSDILDHDAYEKMVKPKLDESFRGKVVDYEMNYTYPQVGERNLAITYLPVEGPAGTDRVAAVLRDVTDRKRAAARLEESEKRFRAVHDRAPVGIALVDSRTGRFLLVNPKYCEIVGRTEQEMLRLSFRDVTHPLDQDISVRTAAQLCEEKIRDYDIEKRYVRPDGRVIWVNLSVVPMWEPGEAGRQHMAIVQDITERRRAEEELRQAKQRLTEEKLYLEHEIDTELGFDNIIGQSDALKSVMESVAKVAGSDATVLLLGETGTGKELIARAIHRLSRRAGNAFIKMNCAAIPSGLLESELFGHERGAFTGAVTKKIGRLELADQGTILLDEIGEISLALQPKLLRVLQDQEFERLGGTQTLKVNFRLIAATNCNLALSVQQKEFRSDLYYRLNVFPIFLPPLRERREDIPLLVEHFVQKIARRMNKSITSIPKRTMDALIAWSWPGNVRELENFLERSLILTSGSVLTAPLSELQVPLGPTGKEETLAAAERRHILKALRETRGQISGPRGAATRLGLKRTTLQSKLKQLGINPRVSV
jgi:PAS domain S-box-containing protein